MTESTTYEVRGVRFTIRTLPLPDYERALNDYLAAFPRVTCDAHLARAFVDNAADGLQRINFCEGASHFGKLGPHELGHVLGMMHTPWHVPHTMNPTGWLRIVDAEGLVAAWNQVVGA